MEINSRLKISMWHTHYFHKNWKCIWNNRSILLKNSLLLLNYIRGIGKVERFTTKESVVNWTGIKIVHFTKPTFLLFSHLKTFKSKLKFESNQLLKLQVKFNTRNINIVTWKMKALGYFLLFIVFIGSTAAESISAKSIQK